MKLEPGIVTESGETIYPTGIEWILAFALKGCKWAQDEIEKLNLPQSIKEYEVWIWRGDGI